MSKMTVLRLIRSGCIEARQACKGAPGSFLNRRSLIPL